MSSLLNVKSSVPQVYIWQKHLLNKLISGQLPDIVVNNVTLKFNPVIKYLGIYLDESIS